MRTVDVFRFWVQLFWDLRFSADAIESRLIQPSTDSDFQWARRELDANSQLNLRIDHGDIADSYSREMWSATR